MLLLAPGVYRSFDLTATGDGSHARSLTIRAEIPGTVAIDTSLEPLRIAGLDAGSSVELVGLILDSGGSPQPALVVERTQGAVLLDGLRVFGGTPAVLLSGAAAVVLQDCELSGPSGLRLANGSRALALAGALGAVEVDASSRLRSFGSHGELAEGEAADWARHAEAPVALEVAYDEAPVRAAETGAAASVLVRWWGGPLVRTRLFVAPSLAFDASSEYGSVLSSARLREVPLVRPRADGGAGSTNVTLTPSNDTERIFFQAFQVDPTSGRILPSKVRAVYLGD
jgi:hypothetical protein